MIERREIIQKIKDLEVAFVWYVVKSKITKLNTDILPNTSSRRQVNIINQMF